MVSGKKSMITGLALFVIVLYFLLVIKDFSLFLIFTYLIKHGFLEVYSVWDSLRFFNIYLLPSLEIILVIMSPNFFLPQ